MVNAKRPPLEHLPILRLRFALDYSGLALDYSAMIENPIIVFGTGRSGTTIFDSMLSEHPGLAWPSKFSAVAPRCPLLNRMLMQALAIPGLHEFLRRKVHPSEAWPLWRRCCDGFAEPTQDLTAEDVTDKKIQDIRRAFGKLGASKDKRLLIKITGWPRLGFLTKVFDDAKYIHIVRDGRAVANSLLRVPFWRGRGGPKDWRWGGLPDAYIEIWEKYDKSLIALAAVQWMILMDAAEKARDCIRPSDLLEIRYEEFCEDVVGTYRNTVDFCGLEWNKCFEERLKNYRVNSANSKWAEDLDDEQQRVMNEILQPHLEKYGYL